MKKSIFYLGKTLSKAQQKQINGGGEGSCKVYEPEVGWTSGWSVEDAQWLFKNVSYVIGYCCASCK